MFFIWHVKKETSEGSYVGHSYLSEECLWGRLSVSQWLLHVVRVDWRGRKPGAKNAFQPAAEGIPFLNVDLSVGYGAY